MPKQDPACLGERLATPVAVVSDAYREGARCLLTDLEHLLDHEIGMTTTLLVGSSRSYVFEDLLVTPRGYGDKYGWKEDAR